MIARKDKIPQPIMLNIPAVIEYYRWQVAKMDTPFYLRYLKKMTQISHHVG